MLFRQLAANMLKDWKDRVRRRSTLRNSPHTVSAVLVFFVFLNYLLSHFADLFFRKQTKNINQLLVFQEINDVEMNKTNNSIE